ncbi:putative MFS family arabinose efflux permease [Krasilnikovia cinnamomea]|uniref:Putative MFS family arabinose efflux permease n=1 Tax=Krasilnikovia cinnamomea TaxID=349313 RepID=A0A4Q7ZP47_9ACTN|nr:MFS transporter [Krasilnikovia cinnamomea]RZU52283.1 putative MFS family arabinose efflux permease [Krasilnikovia cinnamomea]
MTLTPYRETLALRGMRPLLTVATLARIPVTAGPVVLTLHVVQDLGRGYGAAGLVGAAFTVGGSFGAPVLGRVMDRRGLRPILVLTTVAEVAFWAAAQAMPYWTLVLAALVGGFLTLPVFAVARQSITALTPESHRLPAFALDSITTELSFMAGPALGVFVATTAGARAGMLAVGAGILVSGVGLYLLDPAIRSADEAPVSAGVRVPRRSWLRPRLVAVLAVTAAATLVLSGTDVAVVAVLRSTGELEWTGAVLGLWAAYSLLGGFAYGTVRRGLPPLALFAPMALFTIPVGLGGDHWWLLALMLIPAGALCAPTITATADVVSRLAPAAARGEAMGLHNSSLTVGVALGAPLAGVVMDTLSPPWGFAAVGIVGVLVALLALPAQLRHRSPTRPTEPPAATPAQAGTPTEPSAKVSRGSGKVLPPDHAGVDQVMATTEATGTVNVAGTGRP